MFFNFFFEKSIFQVAQCQKPQKEAIQAHSTFSTNRKLQKNARGYPLIKFEKNFRKKNRIVPKKNPKGGPFGLTCTFGSIKIEPTLSGWVEDGR